MRLALGLCFIIACATPPSPRPSAPPAPPLPDEVPRPKAAPVALAGPAACSWSGHGFKVDHSDTVELCLWRDVDCYAVGRIGREGRELRVSVGRGTDPNALIELSQAGLLLRGIVAAKRLFLAPARQIALGGFVAPRQLVLEAGLNGALRVSAPLPDGVTAAVPLATELDCASVELHDNWRPEESLAFMGVRGQAESLQLRDATLTAAPAGAARATLHFEQPAWVDAHQRDQGSRFIVVHGPASIVFGWVPQSALTVPEPSSGGIGQGTSGRQTPTLELDRSAGTACTQDIALYAHVAGKLREVGLVLSGRRFGLGPALDGLHRIEPRLDVLRPGSGGFRARVAELQLVQGTSLHVRAADLAACYVAE